MLLSVKRYVVCFDYSNFQNYIGFSLACKSKFKQNLYFSLDFKAKPKLKTHFIAYTDIRHTLSLIMNFFLLFSKK